MVSNTNTYFLIHIYKNNILSHMAFHTFYLKPNCKRFAYDKLPVGINSLNEILPLLCKAGGFERKTSHSLRVTCLASNMRVTCLAIV